MNTIFKPIFEPYTLNNGVTVRNRLAISPLTHWAADTEGHVTSDELAFLKARKMPNIFRNAAYHKLPEPMWEQMMTFVPKNALRFANIIGKLLGWK